MSENQSLKLIPIEGPEEERSIPIEMVKLSQFLTEMVECSAELGIQPSIPLPIPVAILDKIIAFLEYHFDDPEEDIDLFLDDNDMQQMSDWDRHLMEDLSLNEIFTALSIARYLQIKRLIGVCKKTADTKIQFLSDKQLSEMVWRPISVLKKLSKTQK